MREIKFRFWGEFGDFEEDDKHKKEMLYGDVFCFFKYEPINTLFLDKTINIMQFTGLKDKNGKEIYEGDIVTRKETACNSSYISKYKVGYKENIFVLEVLQSHILKKGAILYRMEDCEIVGNIYENTELLNK